MSDLFDDFKEYLRLSAKLRPEYPESLGEQKTDWARDFSEIFMCIPPIFNAIYSNVSGTKRDCARQSLMDFIPGYRLIHIDELKEETAGVFRLLNEYGVKDAVIAIPMLVNFSSDYICYAETKSRKEGIYSFTYDDGELVLRHNTSQKFLKTISEFYRKGVYFLDDDGYLDYDFEKERVIGAKFNKGIQYWDD